MGGWTQFFVTAEPDVQIRCAKSISIDCQLINIGILCLSDVADCLQRARLWWRRATSFAMQRQRLSRAVLLRNGKHLCDSLLICRESCARSIAHDWFVFAVRAKATRGQSLAILIVRPLDFHKIREKSIPCSVLDFIFSCRPDVGYEALRAGQAHAGPISLLWR